MCAFGHTVKRPIGYEFTDVKKRMTAPKKRKIGKVLGCWHIVFSPSAIDGLKFPQVIGQGERALCFNGNMKKARDPENSPLAKNIYIGGNGLNGNKEYTAGGIGFMWGTPAPVTAEEKQAADEELAAKKEKAAKELEVGEKAAKEEAAKKKAQAAKEKEAAKKEKAAKKVEEKAAKKEAAKKKAAEEKEAAKKEEEAPEPKRKEVAEKKKEAAWSTAAEAFIVEKTQAIESLQGLLSTGGLDDATATVPRTRGSLGICWNLDVGRGSK